MFGTQPYGITPGPGGNLWFTDSNNNVVGEINPTTHAISEFPLPNAGRGPSFITSGPDGAATNNLGLVQSGPTQAQATTTVAPLVTIAGVTDMLNKKHQVTQVNISFGGPVDASEASAISTYRLATPGKKGSYTAKSAGIIKLKSAVYSPAGNWVVLTPKKALTLAKPVQVLIHGLPPAGLEDSFGRLIDGNHDNRPGGDSIALLTRNGASISVRPATLEAARPPGHRRRD